MSDIFEQAEKIMQNAEMKLGVRKAVEAILINEENLRKLEKSLDIKLAQDHMEFVEDLLVVCRHQLNEEFTWHSKSITPVLLNKIHGDRIEIIKERMKELDMVPSQLNN